MAQAQARGLTSTGRRTAYRTHPAHCVSPTWRQCWAPGTWRCFGSGTTWRERGARPPGTLARLTQHRSSPAPDSRTTHQETLFLTAPRHSAPHQPRVTPHSDSRTRTNRDAAAATRICYRMGHPGTPHTVGACPRDSGPPGNAPQRAPRQPGRPGTLEPISDDP